MERPAYLAGSWYPDSDSACRSAIAAHAADAPLKQEAATAVVAPHAGWTYSGKAAGRAYRALAEHLPAAMGSADAVDLVVIFGGHRPAASGHTVFRGRTWQTPLGPLSNAVTLATALTEEADGRTDLGGQLLQEPTYSTRADNAVELQLPFVRYFFPRAEILVVGAAAVPQASALGAMVADLVQHHGRRAVYVASTDLTHYGPNYGFHPRGDGAEAPTWVRDQNDAQLIERILADDAEAVVQHATQHHSACCPGAVAAAMGARPHRTPTLIDHYLSCDILPSENFVGYAGLLL